MKKYLALLLALIVFGGIFISCGNKKNTSGSDDSSKEKWVISKENGAGENGTLLIDLPKETEWDITIYPADTTNVLSNTMLQKTFSLSPGKYDLEIHHIWIKGVPVEKGNSTRLRAGILRIKNKTTWTLYDEAKQTVLINSSAAVSRGLPIGKYKLSINEKDHDIEIRDGETVKF